MNIHRFPRSLPLLPGMFLYRRCVDRSDFVAKRRNNPLRMLLKSLLAPALLFGTVVPSSFSHAENLWLDSARSSITTDELHAHVGFMADDMLEGREAGTRGGLAAARYIVSRLEEGGLKPGAPNDSFMQQFPGNSQNLLAVLEGTDPVLKHEYIVVGAHYDHVGYGTRRNSYGPVGFIHNGADDNASGVATLLEVIDALVQTSHRPRRSILFAFWDGEEKGLLGSKHWMRNPTVPIADVKLAWNIDMVGRLEGGRIEVMGSRTGAGMRQLLTSSSLDDGIWVDFTWEYKDNSDHWTFYQAGIPALCLHTGLHDDYHRPSDDVEKLNIEGMRHVSRYFVEQITKEADAERLPEFRHESRHENQFTQKRLQRALPAFAPRFDFTWAYKAGNPPELRVTNVGRRSMAAQAGLQRGDRIVSVNSLPITSKALLPAAALQAETELLLVVQREEPQGLVEIELPLAGGPVRLGLSWRDDPAEPYSAYVTRVVPYSPAHQAGIKLFDRIHALNGEPIVGQADFLAKVRELLATDANSLQLEIESNGLVTEKVLSFELPTESEHDATL